MFKLIKYLKTTYNKKSKKHIYYCNLIDNNFDCEISAEAPPGVLPKTALAAVSPSAVYEYHKRNLPIIKNIYLLNIFIANKCYPNWSFEELLSYQCKYIDKYHPIKDINFSKCIYPKLLEMHEELSVFE